MGKSAGISQTSIEQFIAGMLSRQQVGQKVAPVKTVTTSDSSRHVKVVTASVSSSVAPLEAEAALPPTSTGERYDTSTFCVASRSISPRTPGRSPLRERSQTAVYEPPPKDLDLTDLDPKDLDLTDLDLKDLIVEI